MKPFAAFLLASSCLGLPASAELEGDIPLGLEAVTGFRSSYVHRGFDLAGPVLDFQLEGEAVLREDLSVHLGGWFATEISDNFTEGAGFIDLRYDLSERFTLGASATYRAYDHSFFKNGFDLGTFLTWYVGEEWDLTVDAYRDFGADAWYANAESGWSYRLSDDAYLGLTGGVSVVDGYYGRSGLNDVYGRASLTYNLTSSISLTPFVALSIELEEADGDEIFGGLWFEVSF